MVREAGFHEGQHLCGDRIGGKVGHFREGGVALGRLAIVVIKIPLPALGCVSNHQQPGFPPHIAIEILHPQLLAPLRPSGKLRVAGDEPVIGEDLRHGRPALHIIEHAPFAGGGNHNASCGMTNQGALHFAAKCLRVERIV